MTGKHSSRLQLTGGAWNSLTCCALLKFEKFRTNKVDNNIGKPGWRIKTNLCEKRGKYTYPQIGGSSLLNLFCATKINLAS
jgi:hypothetical protein